MVKQNFPDESGSEGEEVWEESEEEELNPDEHDVEFEYDSNPPSLPVVSSSPESRSQKAIVSWIVGFLIRFKAKYYIPYSALNMLFRFLYTLFSVLGRFSAFFAAIVPIFPSTLYRLNKSLPNTPQFKRFVVCPKCWKIYDYKDTVSVHGSVRKSKLCHHIGYPNHPFPSRRRECGHSLLKSVSFLSGRNILYPHKVYCYKSLQSSLQELLLRTNFHQSCQDWRSRSVGNKLSDVYDGSLWTKFSSFFSCSNNFGLMLNIDWFQPYKHTTSSVGAIYLTIMNLPRAVRFKRENVILVALIPGPSEPSHDINTLLDPLVDELSQLWEGVTMEIKTGLSVVKEVVRCALLCCACDLPAGRKVCGFLSHSASLGCSKCLKSFRGTVGNMDYSGFERHSWPIRTNTTHRQNVELVKQSRTKTEQCQKETQYGCRYSVLLRLTYFDPPCMLVVDPMHNLFLGSGKHLLRIWLEKNLISSSNFSQIQECVDKFVVPSDIGRLPRKIETGFSGFTADQFKNWIVFFSIPALYNILPREHLECWRHFVLACRILCQHSLSKDEVSLADALIMQFCKHVQILYGRSAVTPNMHMHAHLKEDILNYGPIYGFWLFSFERYNGILGNQPTNNRLPEPQLMERFIADNSAYTFQFPDEFREEFGSLCMLEPNLTGSLSDTLTDVSSLYKLPSRSKYATFDDEDKEHLKILFERLDSHLPSNFSVNSLFRKFLSITRKGKTIGYSRSREISVAPSIVIAEWDSDLFGPPPTTVSDPWHPSSKYRPVKIHYFAKVTCNTEDEVKFLDIAHVSWHFPHPNQHKLGKPVEVWCPELFERYGVHSYLPINKIVSRCVYCKMNVLGESVLIVVPLIE